VLMRDEDFVEAVRQHAEALDIARALGDDSMTVLLLNELARDLLHLREYGSARQALTESAGICRRADTPEGLAYCLEAFAGLAYREGAPELAARLLGAAQGVRDLIAIPVWPLLQPVRQSLGRAVTERLGEASFDTEHSAGRLMKPDDALTLALDGTKASAASRSCTGTAPRGRPGSRRPRSPRARARCSRRCGRGSRSGGR
jgi:hypothetical protein